MGGAGLWRTGERRVGMETEQAERQQRSRRQRQVLRRHATLAVRKLAPHGVPMRTWRLREMRLARTVSTAARVVGPATQTVANAIGIPAAARDDAAASLQRRVWALALPAIGEQLLALGVGLSDTFLSGHLSATAARHLGYGSTEAVAAIGAASTVVWVVLTVFFAVNVGVTALVARATGARDDTLARLAAAQGIVMGMVGGVLVAAFSAPLASAVTGLLGLSGQVAQLGADYLRVLSLALPFTGIASAANAAMRGAGDTKRPMQVMLVVNGANIAGSWLLLNGLPQAGIPAIGVLGSATGAAGGWMLGALVAVWMLRQTHAQSPRLVWANLRPQGHTMLRILRVGLPSTFELIILQVGVITFMRSIVGLGSTAYAANVAMNSVESIGTLPAFGFAVAATSLVGQALGAQDPELAIRSTWATLRPCLAVVIGFSVIVLVAPQIVLGAFVTDPMVLRAGDAAMRISFVIMPVAAVAFVFNGALRGAGDTKFPVIVRAAGTWGVRVPCSMILIPLLALPGGRILMAMDFSTQAALAYWRFRSGRWRRTRV